ncbi:MAG: reverse transcriptase domain-containing protein [Promethearchaeota archaeon]
MNKSDKIQKEGDWWSNINWAAMEKTVKIFQERISVAIIAGDKKQGEKLMKLLVNSESTKLYAIYCITQKNKGRYTPGIDGKRYLTPEKRMSLSNEDFDYKKYKFQPIVKRYIPKNKKFFKMEHFLKNKNVLSEPIKTRSLGIMTIKDKVMAKIISFALIAKWETLFESNVMGFRPGRSRQDAINRVCNELKKGDKVILEADIKDFFENVKHKVIMDKIEVFKEIIGNLLKIKIMENKKICKKTKGIVQGNPLSPILANIALHGMQGLFEVKPVKGKQIEQSKKITLIRYGDDFVVIAPSRQILEKRVLPKIRQFLKKRGLSLNNEKTRIVSKKEGFNFLGYTLKEEKVISIKDFQK